MHDSFTHSDDPVLHSHVRIGSFIQRLSRVVILTSLVISFPFIASTRLSWSAATRVCVLISCFIQCTINIIFERVGKVGESMIALSDPFVVH